MPSSDSEDFESADEGQSYEKKDRKKRLSSSNYSDNALESDQNVAKSAAQSSNVGKPADKQQDADGWDDFDIDDNDTNIATASDRNDNKSKSSVSTKPAVKESNTGWDDFDDWGQDDGYSNAPREPAKPKLAELDAELNAIKDKMAPTPAPAPAPTGGGWGWSMHSLLNTATAGITTLTSQVSQGITTVLETGIGAPEPEELARKASQIKESKPSSSSNTPSVEQVPESASAQSKDGDGAYLPFGNLISGVTKFVETTGPKVISGGLDTLETIGKKTMEILQDGDPGLVKKRAMLGLSSEDKPVLSQVLREAREKAEQEEDKTEGVVEEKRVVEVVNYENLFNDFDGPVYLEALKLLSSQTSMRIEEQKRTLDAANRQAMEETLEMVVEIYELPEKEEDEDDEPSPEGPKPDAFHERLQAATQDLSIKLQFQPVVKQYKEVLDWLSNTEDVTVDVIYKQAVSSLAQATSLSMHLYHKTSELILASKIRSTVDESTALSQLTVVLRKHISDLAAQFAEKLNSISADNKQQVNEYITNIFLEAGNSSTYLETAFQLALPIIQIGAI
ncbi:hypothetical protein O3G_MSEX001242 [Manduca sexta]|uniref:Protein FAM114A2 n=1 Tax=Manduca sexta TaxID=7130 RepID=A0A922C8N1_MANSE|nr:hypothetical protein O3G_MSEX001242 [Manduca sexta]